MLFNREASLVIGQSGGQGKELAGLRFAFSIQKGSTQSPNNCTLRVWNVAPQTLALLDVIGNVVILKAGYSEDIGAITIFTGNITRSTTRRDGPDWVTELEIQDGFLEFRDSKSSISFPKNVTLSEVLARVSREFGLSVRRLPEDIANKKYPAGFAFVGKVRDVMDKVCENSDLEWSIQNREIQIIKKGGVFNKKAYVLSPDSGLIESPEPESKTMTEKSAAKKGITEQQKGVTSRIETNDDGKTQKKLQVLGYKAKTLLLPTLEPGGYVQLKTKSVNGEFFRIEELTHNGDTHGNEWFTELTLRNV